MKIIPVTSENTELRQEFFQTLFGNETGFIGVALKRQRAKEFSQAYFSYPGEMPKFLEWINANLMGNDLYFCPQLLHERKRSKVGVKTCPNLWADLDDVDPEKVSPEPSILVETSPSRYHGYWLLETSANPSVAEDACRKLAYANGADSSGWDLSQLLRIPLTYNSKEQFAEDPPIISIVAFDPEKKYKIETFDSLQEAPGYDVVYEDFPKEEIAKLDPKEILERYEKKLIPSVTMLYSQEPKDDWSTALWALQCILLETGMTPEETFVVSWNAACNKYKRDERSMNDLWKEVRKASVITDAKMTATDEAPIRVGSLLSAEEKAKVREMPDYFVDRYIKWGKSRTDAAWQYHEAGAFVILSCVLAESIHLNTSFGRVIPNLWFAILGDTTLTRKSTAMDMAVELLLTVYDDCILATDGSIEGIFKGLAQRSGRTSLFWRDEFSGMLDSIQKKDYQSGMIEMLTKLYDGKYQKRMLSKDVYEVRDPIFVMFCGGIKSRLVELFTLDHITGGFMPRFVFIAAEADMTAFRPAGPANGQLRDVSTEMAKELMKIRENYDSDFVQTVGGQSVSTKREWEVQLTEEAWKRYNKMESDMVMAGVESDSPEFYTPVMDRLAKSGLKAAMLLAASRQNGKETGYVEVTLNDMLKAISYVDGWKEHSLYMVENASKTVSERTIDRAVELIRKGKDERSMIMKALRLDARQANLLFDTLEQRKLIVRTKYGRTEKLFPTTVK